jgi:hypothetical protein
MIDPEQQAAFATLLGVFPSEVVDIAPVAYRITVKKQWESADGKTGSSSTDYHRLEIS